MSTRSNAEAILLRFLARFNPLGLYDPSFWKDPLVLDLDGDDVELVEGDASFAWFDFDQDGFAEHSGWVSGDDGLLVIDRNGDGIINDISELIGAGFVSPSASTDQLNNGLTGFGELAALDANGDGVLDAQDSAWHSLRVWRDANGDGVTNTGELLNLDEAGVASVALQWTDIVGDPGHNLDFGAADTNVLVQQGTFTRTDGTTGLVGDAWFSYVPAQAIALAPGELDPNVIGLPILWRSGEVLPSPFAMSADPVLREMMQEIAALTPADLHLLSGKVEAFILRWTGADGANAQGRGPYMDGQYMAAMEKFMGFEYRQIGSEPDPFPWAGSVMTSNFKQVQSEILVHIVAQIPLGWELFPELNSSGQEISLA